jgi:CheY-like chemotaxis protein
MCTSKKSGDRSRVGALRQGARDYVTKPVDAERAAVEKSGLWVNKTKRPQPHRAWAKTSITQGTPGNDWPSVLTAAKTESRHRHPGWLLRRVVGGTCSPWCSRVKIFPWSPAAARALTPSPGMPGWRVLRGGLHGVIDLARLVEFVPPRRHPFPTPERGHVRVASGQLAHRAGCQCGDLDRPVARLAQPVHVFRRRVEPRRRSFVLHPLSGGSAGPTLAGTGFCRHWWPSPSFWRSRPEG